MILLMGLAGAGKGTQGKLLSEEHGFKVVAMGDVVREQATPEQRERMLSGSLLGNDEIIEMLDAALASQIDINHIVLDGFPRTIDQAEWLLNRFEKPVAIHLTLSKEAATKRLLQRARADDTAEAIEKRFDEYEKSTAPILEWLRQHDVQVLDIDANRDIKSINQDVVTQLAL